MTTLYEQIYFPSDEANPSSERYSAEDFDDYHAAPLLLAGAEKDQQIVDRQDQLHRSFANAIRGELKPPLVKETVVDFALRSIIGRMHQREGFNGNSYRHRRNQEPDMSVAPMMTQDEILEACEKAKRGEGTPLQNHIAYLAFGMDSAELANLTMINGFRKELEKPMWESISELVDKDASPTGENVYRTELLGFDDDEHFFATRHSRAMRVGMKRLIGTTIDGSQVKSRTTAIINTRPSSGFDQSLIEQFKSMEYEKKPYAAMSELPEFKRAISWLIDTKLPEGLVLARNETVFEHH